MSHILGYPRDRTRWFSWYVYGGQPSDLAISARLNYYRCYVPWDTQSHIMQDASVQEFFCQCSCVGASMSMLMDVTTSVRFAVVGSCLVLAGLALVAVGMASRPLHFVTCKYGFLLSSSPRCTVPCCRAIRFALVGDAPQTSLYVATPSAVRVNTFTARPLAARGPRAGCVPCHL